MRHKVRERRVQRQNNALKTPITDQSPQIGQGAAPSIAMGAVDIATLARLLRVAETAAERAVDALVEGVPIELAIAAEPEVHVPHPHAMDVEHHTARGAKLATGGHEGLVLGAQRAVALLLVVTCIAPVA